ncbi:peptidylprolyl isomerase [Lysinibacillus sp. RC79]|uniref:peptidylprolyl isomerase n=1 Tax=Lysinibacillus sp. RC79 TaxID=3156296 RepID=UPI003511853E
MFARYKGFSIVFALLMVAFVLTGCGAAKDSGQSEGNVDYSSKVKENPIVTITMNNDEKIVIELEPSTAPNTVANFISLVKKGFYDGLIFHRVVPDFMIQGGDPSGNGTGGPDYSIEGEFSSNGFKNDLKHERGVISMARSQDLNSAGSQFFIMVKDTSQLDGDYAAFGKVIEGMEIVDAIAAAERDGADKPLKDQQMKKVEVDTKGFDYPAPKVLK